MPGIKGDKVLTGTEKYQGKRPSDLREGLVELQCLKSTWKNDPLQVPRGPGGRGGAWEGAVAGSRGWGNLWA